MNKKITRGLALALALIMCLSVMASLVASAAEPMQWNKVTEAPADWSGAYLIVYEGEDGAIAFDPAVGDAKNNNAAVTIADGKITADLAAQAVTIAKLDDGYSIQLPDGKFIGNTFDNKNKMEISETPLKCTITMDAEQGILIAGEMGAVLRLNLNNGNPWFRFFKPTTYTNQMPISLYKLDGVLPETPVEPEQPEQPKPTTPAEIVDAAYALEVGAALEGTYTLTGKVTAVNTEYSEQYKNVTVTIAVEGKEDKPIECYRMIGDEAALVAKNDIITVTGVLKNYNGKIEFDAKCTLDARVPSAVEAPEPFDPTGKTVAEILDAAFALGVGDKFAANCTLTGKVLRFDTPYSEQYGNVSVVIDVEGKELLCYRMIGEEAALVAEGDTITVTGLIKNYNGTIEFDAKCTLDARVPAAPVEPEKEDKVITIGDKSFTSNNWIYNEATDSANASKYAMIIYDKNYEGEVATNGWGAALVLDKYGKLVKIYDGANGGFWTEAGKSTEPLTFTTATYAAVAYSELQEGEMLIIFPNDGGDNLSRKFALSLRDLNGNNPYCGKIASVTGFEFEAEPVDPDIPDAGDSTIVFVMMLMTAAMAAIVVLTKKQVR